MEDEFEIVEQNEMKGNSKRVDQEAEMCGLNDS
jgi:hypothetical protein